MSKKNYFAGIISWARVFFILLLLLKIQGWRKKK